MTINENKLRQYIRNFLNQNAGIRFDDNNKNTAIKKFESIDSRKFYDLIGDIAGSMKDELHYTSDKSRNKLKDKFKSKLAQNAFSEARRADFMDKPSIIARDKFLEVVRNYFTLVYKDDGDFNANYKKVKEFTKTLDKELINDCEEILKMLKV